MRTDELVELLKRNIFWLLSLLMLYKGITTDFTEMVELKNTAYMYLIMGFFTAVLGYSKAESDNMQWAHLGFLVANMIAIVYVGSQGVS